MQASDPLDVDQIAKNAKANKALRAKYTIGMVTPSGQMQEVYCPPPTNGTEDGPKRGDIPCTWRNGEPQISKTYKNRGYILYDDLAKQDGEPEKAARWKAAVEQRIMGTKLHGDISSLYSKSVLERRAAYAAGSGATGGKAFDVNTGEVIDDPDAAREKMRDRMKEIGLGDPVVEDGRAKAEAEAKAHKAKLDAEVEAHKAKLAAETKAHKAKLAAETKAAQAKADSQVTLPESKGESKGGK